MSSERNIPVLPSRWYRTNYGIGTGAPYGAPDQRERQRCEIYPRYPRLALGCDDGAWWCIELPEDSSGASRELSPEGGIYRGVPGYKLQRHALFAHFENALRIANAYADREIHPEVAHQDVVRYAVVRDEDTGRYYEMTVWNDEPVPYGAEFHDTWEAASKRAGRRNRALFAAALSAAARRRNFTEK